MKSLLMTLAALLTATAVYAETISLTLTVTPPMTCANCEHKIKNNIRFEKGILDVEPSVKNQKIEIKYDSDKTNEDAIIASFKKIGYVATPATGEPQKESVEGCKGGCCGNKK
jgi:copper chaperone CopZ